MKDLLSKVSDLSRASPQEIKNLAGITRLVALMDFVDSEDEKGDSFVEIPTIGKIKITQDMDFEFIPLSSFRKEIFGIKQNPKNFLKNELRKLLGINEGENI